MAVFLLSELHHNTQFTETPPSTIVVNLGSDVNFRWTLQFGDSTDHSNFEELYWGKTDNNERIRNKYLTVFSDNHVSSNTANPASLLARMTRASGHISQTEITQTFRLESVTQSDAEKTYGCTADVWGEKIESGPITIRGKFRFNQWNRIYQDKGYHETVKLLRSGWFKFTPPFECVNPRRATIRQNVPLWVGMEKGQNRKTQVIERWYISLLTLQEAIFRSCPFRTCLWENIWKCWLFY